AVGKRVDRRPALRSLPRRYYLEHFSLHKREDRCPAQPKYLSWSSVAASQELSSHTLRMLAGQRETYWVRADTRYERRLRVAITVRLVIPVDHPAPNPLA